VHRLAALAEPVDVEDRGEVVELVERGVLDRLPHRAFRHLAVAADHPDAERQLVQALPGDRHADADRETLAERAGRDVDPGERGRRVSLEPAPELPVGHELLFREGAGGAKEPVHERRRVALREDQPVVGRLLRIVEVVPKVLGEQHRGQVGGGHGRRGVPRAGLRAGPDRIDPQLLAELAPEIRVTHARVT
jgi:hypothetical protein